MVRREDVLQVAAAIVLLSRAPSEQPAAASEGALDVRGLLPRASACEQGFAQQLLHVRHGWKIDCGGEALAGLIAREGQLGRARSHRFFCELADAMLGSETAGARGRDVVAAIATAHAALVVRAFARYVWAS